MSIDVSLIANCDDAVVFWRIAQPIKDCWGFAIEREKKLDDGTIERKTLDNRTGFESDKPKSGDHRPSTEWPFQRFWWADFSANMGDTVRYRVTPVIHRDGALHELVSDRSGWTAWTELSGGKTDGYESYFNRGLVISQFMARYLEDLRVKKGLDTRKEALKAFKDNLDDHELPIRKFLAGALRDRMLKILADAKKKGHHVFAALYELADEELVDALKSLKSRAHVVLANGSITAKKGEGAANARKRDENKTARAALKAAKVEVFNRFVSPGALAHNKFLVVCDKNENPLAVWTGSTNWTATGLCTQINNGLYVANKDLAQQYLDQFERLRDAKSAFPDELVEANDLPALVTTGKSKAAAWFTRTSDGGDLKAIDDVLKGAKDGILFLMFQPGGAGALGTVRKIQQTKKSLYVKGVVSTLPKDAEDDESEVSVEIHGADKKTSLTLDVVQPQGIQTPFASWAATVTRNEFLTMSGGVIGFAIVHSKLIVVDPFTNPVVITGSHNFSGAASKKNDENFIIVRDNKELAAHYAAHILSVYQHYRWLAFVDSEQRHGRSPKGFLKEHDRWQAGNLKGANKRELDFWVR